MPNGYALSPERVRALRQAGILLLGSATNVDDGRRLAAAGVHAVVAQGYEAGGHRGVFDPDATDDRLGTMALTRVLVVSSTSGLSGPDRVPRSRGQCPRPTSSRRSCAKSRSAESAIGIARFGMRPSGGSAHARGVRRRAGARPSTRGARRDATGDGPRCRSGTDPSPRATRTMSSRTRAYRGTCRVHPPSPWSTIPRGPTPSLDRRGRATGPWGTSRRAGRMHPSTRADWGAGSEARVGAPCWRCLQVAVGARAGRSSATSWATRRTCTAPARELAPP
jgi:hypothetical protein